MRPHKGMRTENEWESGKPDRVIMRPLFGLCRLCGRVIRIAGLMGSRIIEFQSN